MGILGLQWHIPYARRQNQENIAYPAVRIPTSVLCNGPTV